MIKLIIVYDDVEKLYFSKRPDKRRKYHKFCAGESYPQEGQKGITDLALFLGGILTKVDRYCPYFKAKEDLLSFLDIAKELNLIDDFEIVPDRNTFYE